MSKLTPDQKAANKAAQKVRDKAFTARRREYARNMKAAEEQADCSEFAQRRDAAYNSLEAEVQNLDLVLSHIDAQIAALVDRQEQVRKQFSVSIDARRALRDETGRAFRQHREELTGAVNARYPDLKDVWYVSQWTIPDEVREQMEAAAATEIRRLTNQS